MKGLWILTLCAACSVSLAHAASVAESFGLTGFGTETVAGDGGAIVRVTTLAADGPGSLREALLQRGPRVIIFEVGGVIDLARHSLVLAEPFVTIAGQTAPAPGITLIRGGLEIRTHDVLMQHVRFRMGDAGLPRYTDPAFTKGWDVEVTSNGRQAYNIVIDHSSFAWAVDENLSVSGPRYDGPEGTSHRVTLSNNIIAEGLMVSTHSKKEPHSKGSLIHDNVQEVAILGNLYAHNDDRNPLFKGGTTGVFANNLIYDPGRFAISAGAAVSEWEGRTPPPLPRLAVVGNTLLGGSSTRLKAFVVANSGGKSPLGGAQVYLADNLLTMRNATPLPETGPQITRLETAPLWPEGFQAIPAARVQDAVLTHAGARPLQRDEVDTRIVAGVQDGGGRVIDSQEDVGGYPAMHAAVARHLAVPDRDVAGWLRRLSDDLISP